MANFTPAHSSQYIGVFSTVPNSAVAAADWGGKLRFAYGKLTFTAAGTGTAKMVTLPPGRKIILPDLSRIVCPAGTATAVLHIGFTAFNQPDGVAVASSNNAFANSLAVGAGALDQAWPLPADAVYVMDSKEPVDIEVTIATANSPAAGDMYLVVAYAAAN